MDDFHSVTALFEVNAAALKRLTSQLAPTLQGQSTPVADNVLAIEVIRLSLKTPDAHAVAISTAHLAGSPIRLRCLIAFCNDVAYCDKLRDAGVPVIEAALHLDTAQDRLEVIANHYPKGELGMTWGPLLTVEGIRFKGQSGNAPDPGPKIVFDQILPRPDLQRPGFSIVGYEHSWQSNRELVALEHSHLTVSFVPAQFPDFNSLFMQPAPANRKPNQVYGSWIKETSPPEAKYSRTPRKLANAGTVGAPDYRFEDMELLGFRFNVPPPAKDKEDPFSKLVEPLNFHRRHQGDSVSKGIDDFEYRAATRAIVVELIRYGKMKYQSGTSVLGPDTFMSQHELLVRILVGRVDQDGVQGRNPTTFVQSIFVDNPTSKAVGRDMQGYPKVLGTFCTAGAPGDADALIAGKLRPIDQDGTQDGRRVPLHEVRAVSMTKRVPETELVANKVLDLEYSVPEFPDDNFGAFNDQLLSSIGGLVGAPWRQDDFDDPIFRRSFARAVVNQGLARSRSVQVIPVVPGPGEAQTWLTGTFALSQIRVQQPPGIATLTFHGGRGLEDWDALCNLLATLPGRRPADTTPADGAGRNTSRVSLPSGHWYRVKCNMDLTIDDGLAWD